MDDMGGFGVLPSIQPPTETSMVPLSCRIDHYSNYIGRKVIYQINLFQTMDMPDWLQEILQFPEIVRRERASKAVFIVFLLVLAWFIGAAFSPYLIPSGTFNLGEDGVVGPRDFTYTISQIENPLARFFYDAGDINCHQNSSRSFFLNDNQQPFCARDTAIFLGMVIGVLFIVFYSMELNIFWILAGLVPMAIDGGLQLIGLHTSTNLLRLITGMIAGIVVGIALGYIVGEFSSLIKNRKKHKETLEPVLSESDDI